MQSHTRNVHRSLGIVSGLLFGLAATGCTDVRPLADDDDQARCYGCHGTLANGNPAPPPVGWLADQTPDAHQAHLHPSDWHSPVTCDECHVVPDRIDEPGHIRDDDASLNDEENEAERPRATVTWGPLAKADGASPAFGQHRCTNTYCHGATLGSSSGGPTSASSVNTEPDWYVVDGSQAACGTCHGKPPAVPHPQNEHCANCHAEVMNADGTFKNPSLHIDGRVEVGAMACDSCHGSDGNPAPPVDTLGNSDTTARGVGAHRQHLGSSSWHSTITCEECHVVPATVASAGHIDSTLPAELTWGPLASAHETAPSFDGTTCTNTYCHGSTLAAGGGSTTAPDWKLVDGTQATCTSCHGNPPPSPHIQRSDCSSCHGTVIAADNSFVAPDKHLNGVVDVSGNFGCNTCHGDPNGDPDSSRAWAPPNDTAGRAETSRRGVGAHQAHLKTTSTTHAVFTCSDCHKVPATLNDPGHADTALPAELVWSDIARKDGADPAFNGTTCTNVYCHGSTIVNGQGSNTAPTWTSVGANQAGCGTCHNLPPGPPHPELTSASCGPCHDWTGFTPNDPSTHINGALNGTFACGTCHGVPPQDGAHAVHYGDDPATPVATYGDLRVAEQYDASGTSFYMFGCGNCHPTDETKHMNGTTEVELHTPGVAASSLKALNPLSASYSGGKCQNVYCHSSGQELPAYVETPAWNGGSFTSPRCSSCHDNPPRYLTGGAGTASANTHLLLGADGFEYGHFAGLPGNWHGGGPRHGAAGGSAITCQTCHYDSVDPTSTGPSGFYWLDTTGNYDMGGAGPFNCVTCHASPTSTPPARSGKAWAKAHVNGRRDVVFDPRTTLPAGVPLTLPGGVTRPTRPTWVVISGPPSFQPPGSDMDGYGTWSAEFSGSHYEPTTKTCTNVACHVNQSYGSVSGSTQDPLIWGPSGLGQPGCTDYCHQFM